MADGKWQMADVVGVFFTFAILHLPSAICHAVDVPAVAQEEKVWVVVKPLQCLDNPWEQDWLSRHKNKAYKYPRQDERKIIKAYFAAEGVAVWDIRDRPYVAGTPLCKTCGCERGDTFFLSINASEAPRMKSFGYQRFLPDGKR